MAFEGDTNARWKRAGERGHNDINQVEDHEVGSDLV